MATDTATFPYNSPLHTDSRHFLGHLLRKMWLRWQKQPIALAAHTVRVQELLAQVDPWERQDPFDVYSEPPEPGETSTRKHTSDAPASTWCPDPRRCQAAFFAWQRLVVDAKDLRNQVPIFPGDALFNSELENGGRVLATRIIDLLELGGTPRACVTEEGLELKDEEDDDSARINSELSSAFMQALRISPGYQAVRRYVRCHRAYHRTQNAAPEEIALDPAAGCLAHQGICGPEKGHASASLCDPLQMGVWKEVARAQREHDKRQGERREQAALAATRERQRAMMKAAARGQIHTSLLTGMKRSQSTHKQPSRLDKLRSKASRHKIVQLV